MLFEKIILCYPLLHDFSSVCDSMSQFNGDAWRYCLKYHYLPIKVTITYKNQYQTFLSLSKSKNNKSNIYQVGVLLHNVINFTKEPVVQCDVPVVKNTFVDNGDIQFCV